MYQALYRKYRPRTFEDVVGQEHITETLRRQVELGRTGHAYIFVGTRGTGKTTCAKILSRALNCEHPVNGDPCNECAACRGIDSGAIMDVIEIDAASNGGIEDIRALREAANYTPADVRKRVYILDEAHMITPAAFPALLKILEEPPEHLVFILATTDLAKIPITILSRCQHFSFRRILPEDIAGRLKYVASKEGFGLTDGAAALLARLGDGSMRDALSLLDQCLPSDTVDENAVIRAVGIMGAEDTVKLWSAIARADSAGALELFDAGYRGGAEPISVLKDLLSLARDMLMVRVAPKGSAGLLTGAFDAPRLRQLSEAVDTGRLMALAEILQDNVSSMKDARDKRVKAELCIIKLIGTVSGAYREAESFAPAPQTPPTAAKYEKKQTPSRPSPAPAKRANAAPEPPPPWEEEGPPPITDEDLPPEEAQYPQTDNAPPAAAAEPESPAVPEAHADTGPEPEPAPGGGETGGDWWERTLKICGETLDGAKMNVITPSGNVTPGLSGSHLTLYVHNIFVQMTVDTREVRSAVGEAASRVLGTPVTVTVTVGAPDGGGPSKPALDDLARFDGIVKFK